jgi:hypothetical protein
MLCGRCHFQAHAENWLLTYLRGLAVLELRSEWGDLGEGWEGFSYVSQMRELIRRQEEQGWNPQI